MQKQVANIVDDPSSASALTDLLGQQETTKDVASVQPQNSLNTSEDPISLLCQEMATYKQACRKDNKRHWLLLILMYGVNFVLGNADLHLPSFVFLLSLLLPVVYLWFTLRTLAGRSKRRARRLIVQVAAQADAGSIGPLLDSFSLNDRKTRPVVIAALTSLLPCLDADDTEILTAPRRSVLRSQLRLATDRVFHKDVRTFFQEIDRPTTDFYVAILKAFESSGGPEELATVEWAAALTPTNDRERQIQAAAADCLLVLQPRVEATHSSATLLRASDGSDLASDTLLRATPHPSPVAPEELLRAGHSNLSASADETTGES